MKKLSIYWNNICLLRKKESELLNNYFSFNQDTTFDINFFGLGMPKKLKQQVIEDLNNSNDVNTNIIVSTELDIFWDKNLLRNSNNFYSLNDKFEIREELKNNNLVSKNSYLSICQVLPMLIAMNFENNKDMIEPKSLLDLTKKEYKGKIVLGGSDTAAGRIIVICIWYLYGIDKVLSFLDNVKFVNLPALALSLLKNQTYKIAILPSVLCGRELHTIFPEEGVPIIPTYCCINKNTDYLVAKKFLDYLYSNSMQDFYSLRAFIISANKDVELSNEMFKEGIPKLLYPDQEFFDNFDIEKFYQIMDNIKL